MRNLSRFQLTSNERAQSVVRFLRSPTSTQVLTSITRKPDTPQALEGNPSYQHPDHPELPQVGSTLWTITGFITGMKTQQVICYFEIQFHFFWALVLHRKKAFSTFSQSFLFHSLPNTFSRSSSPTHASEQAHMHRHNRWEESEKGRKRKKRH